MSGRQPTACPIPSSCSLRLGPPRYASSAWKPATSDRQLIPGRESRKFWGRARLQESAQPSRTWLPGALETKNQQEAVAAEGSLELREKPRQNLPEITTLVEQIPGKHTLADSIGGRLEPQSNVLSVQPPAHQPLAPHLRGAWGGTSQRGSGLGKTSLSARLASVASRLGGPAHVDAAPDSFH